MSVERNHATLRGAEAVIKWGWHTAVSLGPWSVEVDPTQRTLTGKVVKADTFRVLQQPLKFYVSRPRGTAWVWPVESLHVADGELTARLGPQE